MDANPAVVVQLLKLFERYAAEKDEKEKERLLGEIMEYYSSESGISHHDPFHSSDPVWGFANIRNTFRKAFAPVRSISFKVLAITLNEKREIQVFVRTTVVAMLVGKRVYEQQIYLKFDSINKIVKSRVTLPFAPMWLPFLVREMIYTLLRLFRIRR